ncbi:hypothetical protein EFP86_15575, partial [Lentilactobacillus hilgardii]|nr:hypothetical protein [Lentilactobacillus hilgardii]
TCDYHVYCERHLIENFFNQLKNFRRIATRYDKIAHVYLATVYIASICIYRVCHFLFDSFIFDSWHE